VKSSTARPRGQGDPPPGYSAGTGAPPDYTSGAYDAQAATKLRRRRVHRILRWTAIGVTVVLVIAALGGYAVYEHLDANLNVVSITGIKHQPPASAPGVENILVLGSQTRNGQSGGQSEFGTDPNTNLSDNILLFHLNATHTRATVVSIPRDTIVAEPACGSVPAIPQAIIDGAMNQGGPTCAVATVDQLTGIRVDHFVRFTFNSFRDMIDAVGGVQVCLKQPIDDPFSHLKLAAGKHFITGNEALEFVRTRHGVGNGGDLGRIQLQQEFISSLMQKVEQENLLADPVTLLKLANVATKDVTVDSGLGSVSALLKQAYGMKSLKTSDVTFVTMPTIPDPANSNRLLPEYPEDDIIWQMLKNDQIWNGHLPTPKLASVDVTVLNGTEQGGLAAKAAKALRKLGFDVTTVANAPATTATTTVSYTGTTEASGAYALMSALKVVPAGANTGTQTITLTLGTNFGGVKAPKALSINNNPNTSVGAAQQAGTSFSVVQTRSAAANICSGLPDSNPDTGTPP
jgi:LCP family protein required for cell wall assembly